MSRVFVHAGQVAKLLNNPDATAPVRYRLMGQLLEIVTVKEVIRNQGYVCELQVKNLPEFETRGLQETVRALVGENVYTSQIIAANRSDHQVLPGAAVSLCICPILLDNATNAYEVLEIQILTMKEIESLRSFAQSAVGAQFVQ